MAETGDFCEAIFTDTDDLRTFAKDWQMILEQDKDSLGEQSRQWPEAPHEVPVAIFLVLDEEDGNLGQIFDTLIKLGMAMDSCS